MCTTIECILTKIKVEVLDPVIAILFVLATIVFLWGIIQYVIGSQGNETKLQRGKQAILWGIVGLTIMASAWGIVKILCDFFGTCEATSSYYKRAYEEYRAGERNPQPYSSPGTGSQQSSPSSFPQAGSQQAPSSSTGETSNPQPSSSPGAEEQQAP